MVGIVPGFEVSTPTSGTPIDPTAFRNAALTRGRVGEAAGSDVANLFQQVADQVQDARNAKKVFDADLSLSKTKEQFLIDIQKDPALASDPGKWVPEYTQRIQQTTQQIMGQPDLGPAVKRHLDMMTQNFAQHSTTDVQMNALHRETEDTKESGFKAATQALQSGAEGSVEKAQVIYKSLLEAGVIGPKVADQLIKQAPGQAAEASSMTAITTNPIKAPELIEQFKGVINPRKFESIVKIAAEAKSRAQRENLNDLSEQMEDAPDKALDPKMLQAKVKSGDITQAGADKLLNRMKRDSAEADKEEAVKVHADIVDHDWVADSKPQDTAKAMAERIAGIQNPGERARLNERLKNYMDQAQKRGESVEKGVHQKQITEMRDIYLEQDAASKLSRREFKERYGDKVKQQSTEAGRLEYAKALADYTDWSNSPNGKDATPEQAAAERERLGFGRYSTKDDVISSFKQGKIDRAMAKKLLKNQFGIE